MAESKTPLTRSQKLGLVALTFAIFLIGNDFTAFSVAVPAIEKHFNSDITTTQWVINGYALVFGVLIVSGGRLADMFGRRRIFFIGTAIFVAFSVLGGLAVDIWMLLICRCLMGVGGAMMWPSVLGMTYNLMPKDRAGQAGGLIMTVAGASNAIGPLLGGTLTDVLSWRWIFFINLPIAALAVFICWKEIADDRPEDRQERIDYAGVTTLSLSLFGLLLALDLAVDLSFKNPLIMMLLVAFFVFMGIFIKVEGHKGRSGLIPEDVASNRKFFAAGLTTLLLSVIFFAALLYIPQYLTKVKGFSAMGAGAGLLPMMVTFALMSYQSGRLYEKLGAKLIITAGIICLGGGMFMLSHLHKQTEFSALVPGMIVLGAGIGLFYPTITTAAITSVDPSRSSLAGAILYMFQIAGGAIGLGMNTTIVAMAPDISTGIDRAFTVNSYLALAGLIVCLLFVSGKPAEQTQ
ncbi:drug resistance transporter, EmrB/QacA subfamily [Microbulbifer donghaiensis]|uniref:Drug resistance transporter, EmrB/QacA subfamily n=1 Tax=Microbulbifer donghaiensis TaxID=494016 RepID=A0A1M4W319_9GAMM|nr:MFS transporter [Microbulbifer donghaiensis]SHE75694.1 drug resistance transporter, EmrB/QacA subfamily [Microbulbifer donghaiensis]